MIKEKILEIMKLALEINPPEVENIGEKKDAVFVEYSPHCNLLDVRIYIDGWKRDADPSHKYSIYLDSYTDPEKKLNGVIDLLNTIKNKENKNGQSII